MDKVRDDELPERSKEPGDYQHATSSNYEMYAYCRTAVLERLPPQTNRAKKHAHAIIADSNTAHLIAYMHHFLAVKNCSISLNFHAT